jgi:site-specific recombinase XerD
MKKPPSGQLALPWEQPIATMPKQPAPVRVAPAGPPSPPRPPVSVAAPPPPPDEPFAVPSNAITEFMAYRMTLRQAAKTVINYGYDLASFERFLGRPALTATTSDVLAYVAQLPKTLAAGTVNRRHISLRGFFRWAMDQEPPLISSDPTRKLVKIKGPKKLPRFLNQSECDRLLESIAGKDKWARRDAAGVAFLFYTGARAGELVGLDIEAIDFEHKVIRVFGKGSKEGLLPMPAKLVPYLRAWLDVHPTGEGAFMAGTLQPHRRMSYGTWRRRFATLIKAAGLKNVTSHKLRHTLATRLRRSGVPLEQIQLLLRHSSVATTQIYAHGEVRDETRAAIEDL